MICITTYSICLFDTVVSCSIETLAVVPPSELNEGGFKGFCVWYSHGCTLLNMLRISQGKPPSELNGVAFFGIVEGCTYSTSFNSEASIGCLVRGHAEIISWFV